MGLWLSLALVAGMHLTVYESDLAVVEESRVFSLNSGVQTLRIADLPNTLDPHTVSLSLPHAQVLALTYHRGLTDPQRWADQFVGHQVTAVLKDNEVVQGKLLQVAPNGLVLQTDRGVSVIPREHLLRLEGPSPAGPQVPLLEATVRADRAGTHHGLLTYHTAGISWQARYRAILNRSDRLDLQGFVWLSNRTDHTFEDASLALVSGQVRRVGPPVEFGALAPEARGVKALGAPAEMPFAEYHLYTVPGTHTLPAQADLQIPLWTVQGVPLRQEYRYTRGEQITWTLVFRVPDKPMPAGIVQVYQEHQEHAVLVGEARIPHTPAGDTLRLDLGNAFDLKAREALVEDQRVGGSLWQSTWQITLWNFKSEPCTVRVIRDVPRGYELVASHPVPPVRKRARQLEFRVEIPAHGKTVLTYTLQYRR